MQGFTLLYYSTLLGDIIPTRTISYHTMLAFTLLYYSILLGDIIPTLAGGTEVKMTEVEIVQRRRLSPGESKKRSYSKTRAPTDADQVEEVQERCKIAIEGHGNQRRSRKN